MTTMDVCGCGAEIMTDADGDLIIHDCPADQHVTGCACTDAYDICTGKHWSEDTLS